MSDKVCKECGETKPISSFSKQKSTKDGLRSVCKPCDVKKVQEYRKKNRAKYLKSARIYHSKNRKARNEANKEYRENNKEVIRERTVRWRKENADHILEYSQEYRKNNSDAIRERINRWNEENRDKVNLYQKLRRTRVRELPSDLTLEQEKSILEYFDFGCALSGDSQNVHLDHVIPVSIGHGGTTLGNIIPLRRDLNNSKYNKNLFEWYADNKERFNLCDAKFEELAEYLASINGVTVEEYRDHVYWCHENPHEVDDEEVG